MCYDPEILKMQSSTMSFYVNFLPMSAIQMLQFIFCFHETRNYYELCFAQGDVDKCRNVMKHGEE